MNTETAFGRWLRPGGRVLVPLLDELSWRVVRLRWSVIGVSRAITLLLDSTVAVRYGEKQAGAEVDYNPRRKGRPGHHPLLAFAAEPCDPVAVHMRAARFDARCRFVRSSERALDGSNRGEMLLAHPELAIEPTVTQVVAWKSVFD